MLKNKIKLLMELIKDSEINEIEVSSFWGAQRIKLSKNSYKNFNHQQKPTLESSNDSTRKEEMEIKINAESKKTESNVKEVEDATSLFKAPLVGTFYLSPNPESEPFVKIGDEINIGDTLCIIEAMKIFNEIKIEDSKDCGKIVEILVEDNTPIEYNQPLFKIIPKK